jgi:5-methylcytosine-specific restriction endonuclease McrA
MADSWREKVYKNRDTDSIYFQSKKWLRLKFAVFKRDKYTCQMCREETDPSLLTAHHIKPRREGGGDSMSNLITLCVKCHDVVEEQKLRTRDLIKNWIEFRHIEPKPEVDKEWRKWVYGGYARPK